jgi:hypothetical protein
MTGGFSRTTDLHSPTAIGDVTPNTGAFTTLAASSSSLGGNFLPFGDSGKNYLRGSTHFFHLANGSTGAAITPDTGKLIVTKADGATDIMALQAKLTTDTNATTGLGAGLLAATTNATITLYDGSGQAYRVPCII